VPKGVIVARQRQAFGAHPGFHVPPVVQKLPRPLGIAKQPDARIGREAAIGGDDQVDYLLIIIGIVVVDIGR